ncbi:uncharacterized protein [Rutidosis leptorrhynchoides]|uniref:uncharacterized protein n=1 Tax=Rutidosis leptorrhynchoides TaxID=125765 RepID=UPI003A98F619
MAQDRQKIYADKRRRPLEFQVGDKVMLKVSPWKGIICFRKRGKLGPRYVGPFEIIARVGKVAYRLALPEELSAIHDTFHVSQLRKCLADEAMYVPDVMRALLVPLNEIDIDEKLRYAEEPIKILDQRTKQLRNKIVTLLKVQWKYRKGSECTWEPEDRVLKFYPALHQEWLFEVKGYLTKFSQSAEAQLGLYMIDVTKHFLTDAVAKHKTKR